MGLSVVVLQKDPAIAQSLAGGLRSLFNSVHVSGSHRELRDLVVQHFPDVAVLDVEALQFADVAKLHQDFPSLLILCTHRIPDEELWMAALEAGAVDVCPSYDVEAILASILRSVGLAQGTAA
jgi:CheY-like chemotaxis protein